jgi:hypothetical protein
MNIMNAYDFLKSKIGYFNTNHPVGTMSGDLPDWGDIIDWMEEYAELKNPDLRRDKELNKILDES